jgi:hypothetical protein
MGFGEEAGGTTAPPAPELLEITAVMRGSKQPADNR